jgi:hypothetical protein
MAESHFDILVLLARPAAGKSEIIHYFKQLSAYDRLDRFHVGDFEEIDDFPMLWTWFEEDQLLQQMGHPRLYTDEDGYFLNQYLWDLLIERMGLDYRKKLRDNPGFHNEKTMLLEFSRGKEHGGYTSAFHHIPEEMAGRMAILYVNVSWEESLRKNRKRFNPNKPDSILEHSLPDGKLERLYRENDWGEITANHPDRIEIQGRQVPYAVMENEDDVTSQGGDYLGKRLEDTLNSLWRLYSDKA